MKGWFVFSYKTLSKIWRHWKQVYKSLMNRDLSKSSNGNTMETGWSKWKHSLGLPSNLHTTIYGDERTGHTGRTKRTASK